MKMIEAIGDIIRNIFFVDKQAVVLFFREKTLFIEQLLFKKMILAPAKIKIFSDV